MAKTNDQPTLSQLTWSTVNDTVMGGRSRASVTWTKRGALRWTGYLSLENNGGFVSIRTRGDFFDWSAYDGVEVTLEAAGRAVQVSLQRGDMQVRAGGYRALVPTNTEGTTRVYIPFSAFELKRFGRAIAGPPLMEGLQKVGQLGLLIADKREGPFAVTLLEFRPVRASAEQRGAAEAATELMTAIERGVPLFNSGDAKGCAAVYRGALTRGLNAKHFGANTWAQRLVTDALKRSAQEPAKTAAWTLRRAIDRILQSRAASNSKLRTR